MTRIREIWLGLRDRFRRRVDRFATGRQRRAARERLKARPKGILVICTGNICRSPYAEALLRQSLGTKGLVGTRVESAGFIGPGRPAEPRGFALAEARGVDLSAHRSRLVQPDDAGNFDLVVAMTYRHRDDVMRKLGIGSDRVVLLGDFDPEGDAREIPDPFGQSDAVFQRVFARIERAIRGLSEHLATLPG